MRVEQRLWRALWTEGSGGSEANLKPPSLRAAAEASRARRNPICVFPEGVRSNGSGILAWARLLDGFKYEDCRVHLLGFRYAQPPRAAMSPTLPVGSAIAHFFWLCFTPSHTMRVSFLPAAQLVRPPPEQESSKNASEQFKRKLAERATGAYAGGTLPVREFPELTPMGQRSRSLLAKMVCVREVSRGQADAASFQEYWADTTKLQK